MKIERSPLELQNFVILNSEIRFIEVKGKPDIKSIFDQYPIDIDYNIRPEKNDLFTIFIKIAVNNDKPETGGYSIFTEGAGIFKLNDRAELPEKDCKHLINFSAVSILINSLRTYIQTLTTFSPFGKFTLPAIDMNHLLQEKMRLMQPQLVEEPKAKYQRKKLKK